MHSARIGRAIWQAGLAMKCRVAPMLEREHGIHFGHYIILSHIHNGIIYPKQLADRMGTPPSMVSRILEELQSKTFISRSLDPEDSRRIRLELTPDGTKVLLATRQTMQHVTNSALAHLGDLEEFTDTLERLVLALEQIEQNRDQSRDQNRDTRSTSPIQENP
jgi:DNA-binding MarR family transcriptional regulator